MGVSIWKHGDAGCHTGRESMRVHDCMLRQDYHGRCRQTDSYSHVCVGLLECECAWGDFCTFPVHILMCQQVVGAAAENCFFSGGTPRADSLHLLPHSSGYGGMYVNT